MKSPLNKAEEDRFVTASISAHSTLGLCVFDFTICVSRFVFARNVCLQRSRPLLKQEVQFLPVHLLLRLEETFQYKNGILMLKYRDEVFRYANFRLFFSLGKYNIIEILTTMI